MAVTGISLPTTGTVQASAPTLVLQPGSVVSAQVLNVLDANLVRIAIDSLTLDVQSLVPLQAGTTLQLAVSQSTDGIRLNIVPDGASASAATAAGTTALTAAASGQVTDTSSIARIVPAAESAATPVLTPAEAAAVATASQSAAARQSGLSGLFANLGGATDALPAPLQQAAAQLLAARPALTEALSGSDVQSAFANSGLFLEAGLAGGLAMPGEAGGPPDLKAALLVFRQLLSTYDEGPVSDGDVTPASGIAAVADAAQGSSTGSSTGSAMTSAGAGGTLLEALLGLSADQAPPLAPGEAGIAAAGRALAQEIEGEPAATPSPATQPGDASEATGAAVRSGPQAPEVPPPPYRGAAPVAQAVATATLGSDATTHEVVRRLAADTDGALARQTLLQIASLPGQGDAGAADRTMPRWNFEIPFATPQGTAVAQFEISGDGGGQAAASSHRVWRARFSLNVEPAGPVHALVSFSGGATSVRMWAERPQTAAQLRASAPELGAALREADLEPGDIVIGDGAPPLQARARSAGRFLDRAT